MVKRHETVREKVGYQEWQHFRSLMEEAREHLSWRQISHRIGKNNKGWATKAYDHRSLVGERDVRDMEELVWELRTNGNGRSEMTEQEKEQRQERAEQFGLLCDRLLGRGLTWDQIADVFGAPAEAVKKSYDGGKPVAQSMIDRGEAALESLERSGEIRRAVNDAERSDRFRKLVEEAHDEGMDDDDIAEAMGYKGAGAVRRLLSDPDRRPSSRRLDMLERAVGGWATGGERPTEVEAPEPVPTDPLSRTRAALMDAASEIEAVRDDFPSAFEKVLNEYRDRIVQIASELE